ncbi:MAG TPA: NUDIX hydrolase [Dehalococcoidia bacterium]|nr:NUDIX hydrolase [Dehalococcoidia bacterium]
MRIVSSEPIHEQWPPISRHLVEFPNGQRRHWVSFDFPDGTAVLAVTPDRRLVLTRQHLMGVDHTALMLPGGVAQEGESLEGCARRELYEETGYTAEEFVYVFRYVNLPSYSRGWVHLYLARNARRDPSYRRDGAIEVDRVELVGVDEARERALGGELEASSTMMAVLAVPHLLERLGWDS